MKFDAASVIYCIDLIGTASFAFSGALRVLDRKPDIVGMIILAGATAVGGSTIRDVVLGREVMFLRDINYPLVILLSAAVTFCFPNYLRKRERFFMFSDALGMGTFAALTAQAAWNTPGMNWLSVLMVATFCACAGGVIRDVIAQKRTLVLTNELYVTPMILGAAGLMLARVANAGNMAGLFVAMFITIGVRLLAIIFDWRLPRVLVSIEEPGPAAAVNPKE